MTLCRVRDWPSGRRAIWKPWLCPTPGTVLYVCVLAARYTPADAHLSAAQEPMKSKAPQLHLEYRFYRQLGTHGRSRVTLPARAEPSWQTRYCPVRCWPSVRSDLHLLPPPVYEPPWS